MFAFDGSAASPALVVETASANSRFGCSASDLFPNATLLKERFDASGFFALKLQDSSGRPIGLLAGINRAALHPRKDDVQMIKLFAARAHST